MKKSAVILLLLSGSLIFRSQTDKKRGTIRVKMNRVVEFDAGEALFKSRCSYCHSPYPYDREQRTWVTELSQVSRTRELKWIYTFLRTPDLLRISGDTTVLRINKMIKEKDQYKRLLFRWVLSTDNHPSDPGLTLRDINRMLFYIDSLNIRQKQFREKED